MKPEEGFATRKTLERRVASLNIDPYNRPLACSQCGGVMVFVGVGEYHCEKCGHADYDDYGKVRNYIEKHAGATAAEVEMNTGVSQRSIRNLLKDERIEISQESAAFLRCEICGAQLRSGRFCMKCITENNRRIEAQQRSMKNANKNLSGVSTSRADSQDGAKRFSRS